MRATYRLQLHAGFGFTEAAGVAGYLAELGVSHLYLSPYLQAAPGSSHGYDVIDHTKVNAELGGESAHRHLVEVLRRLGLGQVVDLVPNHMAIGPPGNRWWWDVLENGPSSVYAEHFDVDWDPPESKLANRVLMPILHDHYGRVLEAGEIRLRWDVDAHFRISYRDHVLPVSPRSLDEVMLRAASRDLPSGADDLAFIGHSLARLPSAEQRGEADMRTRHRDKEVLHAQLARLAAEVPEVTAAIAAEVEALNSSVGALDAFLERQNYRLAHWRIAGQEVDYRRFFDINTLVGLRVESEEVFGDTHRLIFEWLAVGEVEGLRVDHPDGLRDPLAYFRLLRSGAPDAWIVVEKILEPGEQLPEDWPVDGTTGYDFCYHVTRLLHDPRGESPLRELHAQLVGKEEYADSVHAAKHLVLDEALAADVSRLTSLFVQVAERNRNWRDFTRRDLMEALVETAACMPVYRSYVRDTPPVSAADLVVIGDALAEAVSRRPELDPESFDFLGMILRAELEPGPGLATELRLRFQQLTGPVMAKAVEDTIFYDHVPLVSLNEVGSDPSCFALEPGEVHESFARAARRHPRSMLALSTHDTKRSEDVRARLAVLSELPGAWAEAVQRWMTWAEGHWRAADGDRDRLDRRIEYLLYQTMVGAHPLPLGRALQYVWKAAKEAKRNTSWVRPDEAYDAALRRFVEAVYADDVLVADISDFAEGIVAPGRVNSLAQKLVQLTAPGVPDIYQGCELWDLSLVDPDNRRPVDFELRSRMLGELPHLDLAGILARSDEGMTKLHVVCSALALRRTRPGWFASQEYRPLPVSGHAAANAFGFLRGGHAATVVCRLPVGLEAGGGWRDTTVELPAGTWFDVIHGRTWPGGEVYVADLFDALPVALLHDDESLGDRAWIEPRS